MASFATMTWEVRFSNTRQLPYFYNPDTQVSMWELPEGMTEEQARSLPGGSLLGEAQADQPAAAQAGGVPHAKDTIRASHILIKHKDSRRPSSHRQSVITRTKEEAIQTLHHLKEKLGPKPTPEQFSQAAQEHRYVFLFTNRLATARPHSVVVTWASSAAAKCSPPLKRQRTTCRWVRPAMWSTPTAVFILSSVLRNLYKFCPPFSCLDAAHALACAAWRTVARWSTRRPSHVASIFRPRVLSRDVVRADAPPCAMRLGPLDFRCTSAKDTARLCLHACTPCRPGRKRWPPRCVVRGTRR